jgi:hypothetical protein
MATGVDGVGLLGVGLVEKSLVAVVVVGAQVLGRLYEDKRTRAAAGQVDEEEVAAVVV